jgi:dipeptidyl aminopeptidase/acylaminoacyl peptidase
MVAFAGALGIGPSSLSAQALLEWQGQVEAGNETRFAPGFTLEQAVQTRVIRQFDLSPDGRHIAFGIGGYDHIRFGEDNNIRVVSVETGEVRKITTGIYPKTNPVFSPQGDRVLYNADSNLWYVDLATGRVTQVTASERGEGDATWSPDGHHVAFVSSRRPEAYGERGGRSEIWVTDARQLQDRGTRVGLRKVTDTHFSPSELQWSPDGSTILFSAVWPYDVQDPDNTHVTARGIFSVPAAGGSVSLLTPEDNFTDNFAPRWSPDGRHIAFISDRNGFAHLWVMDADGSNPRHFDWGPHDSPRMGLVNPVWSRDGRRILVSVNRDGRFDLDVADVRSGRLTTVARALDQGGGTYREVGWGPRGELVYLFANGWSPPDFFIRDTNARPESARQLTHSSHAAFRRNNFAVVERVEYPAFDGMTLKGLVLRPQGKRDTDRLPALLWLHGGMYGHAVDEWMPYFHYLAQAGYVVGMLDVRGSGGRGREFREAIALEGGYGQHYLEDLKSSVRFLQDLPYVDGDRVGVFGKSHGGYRAMWLMTMEPGLVRAGVNLMGPTDRRAPFNNRGGRFHIRVGEDEDPEYYDWLSPVTQVARLRAPVMNIHTDRDVNVPAAMTELFVDEMKRHGKEFVNVYYRDEAHGLADPENILDHWERMLHFFDRHLRPSQDLRR